MPVPLADFARTLAAALTLDRPLVCLDLEATGIWVESDRIVQIALARIAPDGTLTEWDSLVNPEQPIPAETTAVHGLRDADVATAPTFAHLVPVLTDLLGGCDMAGYNAHRFDRKLLAAEFRRARAVDPTAGARVIDAYTIFVRQEQRTLDAALRFYGIADAVGPRQAHDARSDVAATVAVLAAQFQTYPSLPRSVEEQAGVEGRRRHRDVRVRRRQVARGPRGHGPRLSRVGAAQGLLRTGQAHRPRRARRALSRSAGRRHAAGDRMTGTARQTR
jgi:DNA polymerase-3 subunit epsilon